MWASYFEMTKAAECMFSDEQQKSVVYMYNKHYLCWYRNININGKQTFIVLERKKSRLKKSNQETKNE